MVGVRLPASQVLVTSIIADSKPIVPGANLPEWSGSDCGPPRNHEEDNVTGPDRRIGTRQTENKAENESAASAKEVSRFAKATIPQLQSAFADNRAADGRPQRPA